MRAEELAQLLPRQPFSPFRIHVTTGRLTKSGIPSSSGSSVKCANLALDPDPKAGVIDRSERVSLLHVVRIEDLQAPSSASTGNGDAAA
jgi:hypothetical protein